MRVDPHSSKAYVFLMTVEAVWLVVAALSVWWLCCAGSSAWVWNHLVHCSSVPVETCSGLQVTPGGQTQWCDTAVFEHVHHSRSWTSAGLLHCSEALAWLPVAGAGQEVDQEADGKSAMRIWKTVLFLSAALLCDSAVCHAFWTFWAAYCPCWGAFSSVQHIDPLSFNRRLSDQIVFSCCNETVRKFWVLLCS